MMKQDDYYKVSSTQNTYFETLGLVKDNSILLVEWMENQ